MSKPKYISLFSGAGGFDLGFHNAGWQCLAMVEYSKDACATLRCNWTFEGVKKSCYENINRINSLYLAGEVTEQEKNEWIASSEDKIENHFIV